MSTAFTPRKRLIRLWVGSLIFLVLCPFLFNGCAYSAYSLDCGYKLWRLGGCCSLTIAAIPFFARIAEVSLREVDQGLIEAAQAMGCNRKQIIWHVLLPEALPGIGSALP
ncbi:ABC transporter permease subunit [Acinetobacter seifertii]|nr:ABC transporter permease subunit [Acinetobacter seifertii]